jgi:hypothetical protein
VTVLLFLVTGSHLCISAKAGHGNKKFGCQKYGSAPPSNRHVPMHEATNVGLSWVPAFAGMTKKN